VGYTEYISTEGKEMSEELEKLNFKERYCNLCEKKVKVVYSSCFKEYRCQECGDVLADE